MKCIAIILIGIFNLNLLNAQIKVNVCQLGNVDSKVLEKAKKIVLNQFGYECSITAIKKEVNSGILISGSDNIINGKLSI